MIRFVFDRYIVRQEKCNKKYLNSPIFLLEIEGFYSVVIHNTNRF